VKDCPTCKGSGEVTTTIEELMQRLCETTGNCDMKECADCPLDYEREEEVQRFTEEVKRILHEEG